MFVKQANSFPVSVKAAVQALVLFAVLSPAGAGRPSRDAPPDVSYEINGLDGPVRIMMDLEGIPHILARIDRDAYFALGYVHARDRWFQMDYSRRLFSGTLAELMGESALDSDIQFRTLGLKRAAEQSQAAYSSSVLKVLEAYAEGVNWYLESDRFQLPPEYAKLEISQVRPWDPLDSITVAKGIAFGLSFDYGDLSRSEILQSYQDAGETYGFNGTALFEQDLFRSAPFDDAVSIPGTETVALKHRPSSAPAVARARFSENTRRLIRRSLLKLRNIPVLKNRIGPGENASGSNFWVIGPDLSKTGNALLANDPHLSLDYPSIFYEAHLMVTRDRVRGEMNVSGVTFPGIPAFPQGCNETVCWGSTVNPMDVTDVYEEKILVAFFPLRAWTTF